MNSASPARPVLPPCPLDAARPAVERALAQTGALALSALPGAGKSSRTPLWLLDAPWLEDRNILLLEPRRVAARALARYMARLLGEETGQRVGLRMRDESLVSPATRVEVVTEGVLTRMLQHDPELARYACVIFDEFHERSLTADTGLALCLESRAVLRPDLRLAVMSATLDLEAVSRLLGNCPTVVCEGKMFPVELRHLPRRPRGGQVTAGRQGPLLWRHMADVITHLMRTEEGSLLAFLPGTGEIRHTAALLEGALPPSVALCPLYGNLSAQAQDAAIAPAPPGQRKVVLATAIAETSLTIEGVRLVVDSGLARLARFDPASGQTRLVTERVSLAGAAQRAGRAGRTEPGICCRLWAREEENGLRPHIRPEILDADLSGLALQLAAWGASAPERMAWIDPPPPARLAVALQCLHTLGALDAQERLTALGRQMAALPLAPRPARLLLWGKENGHAALACCVAALLEERDPLARSAGLLQERAGPAAGCDLARRLDWLCGQHQAEKNRDRPEQNLRPPSGHPAQRLAQRLARLLNVRENIFSTAPRHSAALGALVAAAWPERVAMRLPEQSMPARAPNPWDGTGMVSFLLRSGRAVCLPAGDALARQPFLAVADVDGAVPRGRIRLAAALEARDLEDLYGQDIRTEETLEASEAGQISARRKRLLDALVLEDTPLPRPTQSLCAAALCRHLRERGLGRLPWDAPCRQWRARVALLRELDGDPWPDISDAALLEDMEIWLAPALAGCRALGDLAPARLLECLQSRLPGHLRRRLESQAPTHWQVPSGALRPIVYGEEGGPWLAAKLQELFGCRDNPRIAEGRVALVVRLNSPAGRPLQVTRDLGHFWRNGYPAVRAEMRGRYPRHPWPEDPLKATPTVLTKKKLAAQGKG